jgi:hypothetical protein
MSNSFAAPPTIRRIAARRVFLSANGKPVVLTLGVPQPVPGSDWGCALQITGLNTGWRRPRYVFGIDGLQALHLAMKCAASVLESTKPQLEWLGEKGDLGMPRFLPELPTRSEIGLKRWSNVRRPSAGAVLSALTRRSRSKESNRRKRSKTADKT